MIKIKKEAFKALYDSACDGWKQKFDVKFLKSLFSDELEFEEEFLQEMKNACNPEQLKIFLKTFKTFVGKKDLFSIITYSAVCKELKEKELTLSDFSHLPEYMRLKAWGQAQIQQIEKLFNGNWIKNWKDENQRKWYPYFTLNKGGLVFSDSTYGYDYADGQVGFYLDEKTSNHIGKNFLDIYQKVI